VSTLAGISGIAGDDLGFTLALTYDGTPLDLTGLTVTAVIKPRPTSADSDGTSYAAGTGITVTDAASGAVSWEVPHADTAAAGQRAYHVRVTDADGRIATALYGILTLAPA
jgi:hypothetical protein